MTTERLNTLLELAATLDNDEKDWLAKALRITDYEIALHEIQQRVWRPYFKHGYNGQLDDIIARNNQEDDMGEHENDVLDAIQILHQMYLEILESNNITLG
jgi:hypothetical protein